MTDKMMKDPVNNNLLAIKKKIGIARLGLMNNQVWEEDPRRLLFTMSRYKFVAKMFSGCKNVLEVGCGDAFFSRLVKQEVEELVVSDFDPLFIEDIEERMSSRWVMETQVVDMLNEPADGIFDAIYCLDVLEHIAPEKESIFLSNMLKNLKKDGKAIIGMPSLESQLYASPASKDGHINCKTGDSLANFLQSYFHHVFIFSMNDEVIHTGYQKMAHYLIALCCQKRD